MIDKEHKTSLADKVRYPEAAGLLGIPLGTLYSLVSRRQVPHIRLGPRLVVFSKSELEQWIDDHRVEDAESNKPNRRRA
jgi:excisionase family DNA binding protein